MDIANSWCWRQNGRQNYDVTLRNGARYTIDRLGGRWIISYLPTGNAEGGREAVPWLSDHRSVAFAREACAADLARRQRV